MFVGVQPQPSLSGLILSGVTATPMHGFSNRACVTAMNFFLRIFSPCPSVFSFSFLDYQGLTVFRYLVTGRNFSTRLLKKARVNFYGIITGSSGKSP